MGTKKNKIVRAEPNVKPSKHIPIVTASEKPLIDEDFIKHNTIGKVKIEKKDKNTRNN